MVQRERRGGLLREAKGKEREVVGTFLLVLTISPTAVKRKWGRGEERGTKMGIVERED